MTLGLDLLTLILLSFGIMATTEPGVFLAYVTVGLLLAGLCWYGCNVYTRLWNRRFRLKP